MKPETLETLQRLFGSLDYDLLGELYCDEGGAAFWADRKDAVLECGVAWADALVPRLPAGGKSLYMGAGVAELPAMCVEVLELGRGVAAANLLEPECAELNQKLQAVGVDERLRLQAVSVEELFGAGPFDHFTMVSVFTDPDFFPSLSGVTYGRIPPVLLDTAAFDTERRRAGELVAGAMGAMQRPFWLTTSVEEASWFLHEAEKQSLTVTAADDTLETAVIGDPIGFLHLD